MIKSLQQELVQLGTSNERLLQANNEQEHLIRDLTSRSIHQEVEKNFRIIKTMKAL